MMQMKLYAYENRDISYMINFDNLMNLSCLFDAIMTFEINIIKETKISKFEYFTMHDS